MTKKLGFLVFGVFIVVTVLLVACSGSKGSQGPQGAQGPQGSQGPQGAQGPQGPGVPVASADRQVNLSVAVSKPANGTNFVVGEQPVLTITLKDQMGKAFNRADELSQLRLMAAGPIETNDTTTAVKLLKTTADRTQAIHHYIDLKTNTDVQVSDTVLTYKLGAVSDEKPGTYTASVWALSKANGLQQAIAVADFQVGTATVETPIVDKSKCASCHLGADSGKFYFHHIDQGAPTGSNWSLDQAPVTICKTCHNNDGYSAYTSPADGKTRVPDPIVNRVHGVHNGEGLKNPLNTDPSKGVFKDYTDVVFPANVKDCAACHVDDRWKTKPSRLACGTCHDNIWFGDAASMPNTAKAHPGGPQANDLACAACHTPDGSPLSVGTVHKLEWNFQDTVELAMTPPANGKFYVAGETPKLTITVKDSKTGTPIDPGTIVPVKDSKNVQPNEWRRANLFVSGPREGTKPVLTTEALKPNPNLFYAENDLFVQPDPAKADPRLSRTPTSIMYQLADVAGLKAGTYTAFVEVTPSMLDPEKKIYGGWAMMNFQIGTDKEEPKVATNCLDCHRDNRQHPEFFAVKYDTDICKSCHDYERQAPGVVGFTFPGGWNGFGSAPIVKKVHGVHFGRYLNSPEDTVFPALRKPGNPNGFDFSDTIFPQDVRNCTKCHSTDTTGTWKAQPSSLACLACHDSASAKAHASLMTQNPTPNDSWNEARVESCVICHGPGKEFSPDKVHNISTPFKPPYPREPAE